MEGRKGEKTFNQFKRVNREESEREESESTK